MAAIRSISGRGGSAIGALALAMVLAGCAGADLAGLVTPAAAPEPASATPATVEATPVAATPAPARATRSETPVAAAPPAAAPAPTAGLTKEEINTECWMRADTERRLRDIDARLAFVKRCVAERTKSR